MRSYYMRNQHYQTLAPWDGQDHSQPRSMVKTFQKPEFIVRNQDLSPREVRMTLPSLQHHGKLTRNQTRLLKESVGQQLFVARPDVINNLQGSMRASDQMRHGTISTIDLQRIFEQQNVRLDENVTKSLVTKFDGNETGRIPYADLLDFMSDALHEYKLERDRNEFQNLPRYPQRSRVRHPSMNSTDFNLAPLPKRGLLEEDFTEMPGAYTRVKLNENFNERRDAGIRIEVEKSFQNFQGDTYFVVQNLKKTLMGREEDLINSYKLKGIVTRHQLPINDALVDKMIERLDPFGSGTVSCKGFMEFLEKSLPLPNGYGIQLKTSTMEQVKAKIPERPKWETSKPLKAIKTKREAPRESLHISREETDKEMEHKTSKEFERFMKLVKALGRRAKGSDKLATDKARETIVKYNELFALGFSETDVNSLLQRHDKRGYVEVDNIIDGLEELKDGM